MGTSEQYCRDLQNRVKDDCVNSVHLNWVDKQNKLVGEYNNKISALREKLDGWLDECKSDYLQCLSDMGVDFNEYPLLLTPEQLDQMGACDESYGNCITSAWNDYDNEAAKLASELNKALADLYTKMLDTSNPDSDISNCYRKGYDAYASCMRRSVGPLKDPIGDALDAIGGMIKWGTKVPGGISDAIPRLPRD